MILTMVDAQHRLVLYKYNGKGLEELGALRVTTDDPTELAQIAATLALMAGEKNGSEPTAPKKVTAAKPKPKALPKGPARRFNAEYAPDLLTDSGRMMTFLAQEGPHTAKEVAEALTGHLASMGASLSQLASVGVFEKTKREINGRQVNVYGITQHGLESIARSRALG